MRRAAITAAVVACLSVAGTATAALVVKSTEGDFEGGFPNPHVMHGTGSQNITFEVPTSPGWTYDASTITGYDMEDGDGSDDPVVRHPAFYRRGFCEDNPEFSSRGFAASPPSYPGDDAKAANTALADKWIAGVRTITKDSIVSSRTQRELHGGWYTEAVVDFDGSQGVCDPPRIQISLISLDTGEAIGSVLVLADLDVGGGLDQFTIERIIGSARVDKPAG